MQVLSERVIKKLKGVENASTNGYKIRNLSRIICEPELWQQAYLNIYANEGAITKGSTNVTLDGYSPERAVNYINWIKKGEYKFSPARIHQEK